MKQKNREMREVPKLFSRCWTQWVSRGREGGGGALEGGRGCCRRVVHGTRGVGCGGRGEVGGGGAVKPDYPS